MKANLVSMPHQMTQPGDICLSQSVVEAHPGNYWLYYWLPRMERAEAVRVCPYSFIKDSRGPRMLTWNGSITASTVDEPLDNEKGDTYLLTGGIIHKVER